MRAYVGRGLRADLERLDDSGIEALVDQLRSRGVDETLLADAVAETAKGRT